VAVGAQAVGLFGWRVLQQGRLIDHC
jgi:hypothetical protein